MPLFLPYHPTPKALIGLQLQSLPKCMSLPIIGRWGYGVLPPRAIIVYTTVYIRVDILLWF
jgi:hypothetical protein